LDALHLDARGPKRVGFGNGRHVLEVDLKEAFHGKIVLRLRLSKDIKYNQRDGEYSESIVAGTLSVMGVDVPAIAGDIFRHHCGLRA